MLWLIGFICALITIGFAMYLDNVLSIELQKLEIERLRLEQEQSDVK